MKFEDWLPVYGDVSFRGDCPSEGAEQIAFFSIIRMAYPDTYGLIALHPKNEGKRTGKQFSSLAFDKAKGLCKSASDIIIPGNPSFVCELKRQDHTKSSWQPGQVGYLEAAKNNGSFVCVALGAEAAMIAFNEWIRD
jgi:hypothetical protein